jgi:hypothetical protein
MAKIDGGEARLRMLTNLQPAKVQGGDASRLASDKPRLGHSIIRQDQNRAFPHIDLRAKNTDLRVKGCA